MLATIQTQAIDRSLAIAGLTRIRQEWQEAAESDGKQFDAVTYLLYDVANAIGLTSGQRQLELPIGDN